MARLEDREHPDAYLDKIVADTLHEIETRPITAPKPGQRVDVCHYSRTGWAVAEANGACTCMPAEPPGSN
jgi:hypothetical protein